MIGKVLFGWAPSVSGCVLTSLPHPEDATGSGGQQWERGKQHAHTLLQDDPETHSNYMTRSHRLIEWFGLEGTLKIT